MTLATDDHEVRFKRAKDKVERIYRDKIELEARKKAVEEQITALANEIREMGIDPAELRPTVERLEKEVSAKLTDLESILDKADVAARGA